MWAWAWGVGAGVRYLILRVLVGIRGRVCSKSPGIEPRWRPTGGGLVMKMPISIKSRKINSW